MYIVYIQEYIYIYMKICVASHTYDVHPTISPTSEQSSESLLVDYYMGLYGVLTIQYIILFNRYFQVFSQSTEKFVLHIAKTSCISSIHY